MRPSAPASRTLSALSRSVQTHLNAYTLAAGASGVALLALPQSSEAEIVYTPTNQIIGRQGSYSLDLNHDGIVDFRIVELVNKEGSFGTFQSLRVKAATGNEVQCSAPGCVNFTYARTLRAGAQIGSKAGGWEGHYPVMAVESLFPGGRVYYWFPWANVSNRYLGLKFKINGQYHYGWARLNVKFRGGSGINRTWEAQLTGYAYETIPNKAITAGQTSGNSSDDDASAAPSKAQPMQSPKRGQTLGSLAVGSALIPWRRKENEPSTGSQGGLQ
jgi:hypothetical protein